MMTLAARRLIFVVEVDLTVKMRFRLWVRLLRRVSAGLPGSGLILGVRDRQVVGQHQVGGGSASAVSRQLARCGARDQVSGMRICVCVGRE